MYLKLLFFIIIISCGNNKLQTNVQSYKDSNGNSVSNKNFLKYPKNKRAVFKDKDGHLVIGPRIMHKVAAIYPPIALKAGIETISFDRGGYLYHGRVKSLADGAREAGLKF